MDKDFYPTLVALAKLGASGVGVAIFLMAFFLLIQGKPVDPATAKLRGQFLLYGLVFALALLVIPPLLQKGGGPISERLAFSPDFETEKLQPPKVELPDGTVTQDDAKFSLQPVAGTQVVTIAMDRTLNQVRNLRQASANLTSAFSKATEQRDSLAAQAAAVKQPSTSQSTPALQNLQQNSKVSAAIKTDFVKSLSVGDYAKANALAGRLQTSVKAAEPAVAVIARQQAPSH